MGIRLNWKLRIRQIAQTFVMAKLVSLMSLKSCFAWRLLFTQKPAFERFINFITAHINCKYHCYTLWYNFTLIFYIWYLLGIYISNSCTNTYIGFKFLRFEDKENFSFPIISKFLFDKISHCDRIWLAWFFKIKLMSNQAETALQNDTNVWSLFANFVYTNCFTGSFVGW